MAADLAGHGQRSAAEQVIDLSLAPTDLLSDVLDPPDEVVLCIVSHRNLHFLQLTLATNGDVFASIDNELFVTIPCN